MRTNEICARSYIAENLKVRLLYTSSLRLGPLPFNTVYIRNYNFVSDRSFLNIKVVYMEYNITLSILYTD